MVLACSVVGNDITGEVWQKGEGESRKKWNYFYGRFDGSNEPSSITLRRSLPENPGAPPDNVSCAREHGRPEVNLDFVRLNYEAPITLRLR